MKAIFLLIALYTIAGKDAQPSGDIPAGASYEYTQTGSRSGQMTADNSIMLRLTGFTGCTLQGVTLEMKSNTSAGAGWLRFTIGDEMVWYIDDAAFSSQAWAGAYSTEWVEISHALNGRKIEEYEEIQLHIGASVNSLYIQSVAIDYTAAEPQAYTVRFATHVSEQVDAITERNAGAGVLLPDVQYEDENWQFKGWTETPTMETTVRPRQWQAGETYYPQQNCTLHAVYVSKDAEEEEYWWPADELSTGDYLMTLYVPEAYTMYQATGEVTNGMIAALQYHFYDVAESPIAMQAGYTANEVYTLTMLTDSTLSIKHKATNKGVNLGSGGKFKTSGSGSWKVRSRYNETDQMTYHHLSGENGGKEYVISLYLANDGEIYFRPVTGVQDYALLLYALDDEPQYTETKYTSYPLGFDAIEATKTDAPMTYRMNMGAVTLIIQNGQKYLQINE